MADEPCLEAGTFRVDRLAERMAARKKYYGFPLKDAPFLVPYVDFQQEHEDGQFGRYFFGGLECIDPDACWRLKMNIDYAFDSGHRYGDLRNCSCCLRMWIQTRSPIFANSSTRASDPSLHSTRRGSCGWWQIASCRRLWRRCARASSFKSLDAKWSFGRRTALRKPSSNA